MCIQTARAQWITQNIPLSPGWNAVYLQITPATPFCDELFANYPNIQSVWVFNSRQDTTEFVENPATLIGQSDRWLVWLPKSHADYFVRTLNRLEGGHAFLIKLAENAAPMTLQVKGRPALPSSDFAPNALNFIGLPVREDAAPTFAAYFQSTPEAMAAPGASSGIYAVAIDGKETQIRQTARTRVVPGAGYWVKFGSYVKSSLPLEITGAHQATGILDFGSELKELSFTLRNLSSSNSMSFSLTPRVSEAAPSGQAELAGPVPLSIFESRLAENQFGWADFTSPVQFILAPGAQREVRLAIRRSALTPYHAGGVYGAAYQSLLEVVEFTHGYRILLPVAAESDDVRRTRMSTDVSELPVYNPYQGLWIGQATINKVSRTASGTNVTWDTRTPQPVSSSMNYRLMVHVDAMGKSRMLQKVVLSSGESDTNQPNKLYRDEKYLPANTKILSRISTVAFPLIEPVALTGIFANALAGSVHLDYDDPVNPFKHAFHPDHNNLNEEYTEKLPAGVESYTVDRDILFDFAVIQQSADGRYLPPGPVLDFSGTNQYVKMDAMNFGGDCTLMAWMRVENPTQNNMPLLEFGNGNQKDNVSLFFNGTSGKMAFKVAVNGVESTVITTNTFPSSTWVHVTAVNSGNGLGMIYWNGELQAMGNMDSAGTLVRTNNYVGRDSAGASGFFQGRMYDVVVWDDVRTVAEIKDDMLLSTGDNDDYMAAYFKANEGQGNVLGDVSGNQHQAVLNGAQWDRSEMIAMPFWGIGECSGKYREKISGLRPQPLIIEGTFSLERVNRDSVIY